MECNKLIKLMLNGQVKCTEEFFGAFCLFANKIIDFDTVRKAAEAEHINIVQVCEDNNLSFELILKGK